MKKILYCFIIINVVFNIDTDVLAQKYKLIWSDEFNYSGLPDSTNWTFEEGMKRNNEVQYYTKRRRKNAWVRNGSLTIEARKEHYRGGEYTSASIMTHSKKEFLYGRLEMRAKLPLGRGTWPAFWLIGTNIKEVGWPQCGEIDIMEYVGFDSLQVFANINTKAYNHSIKTGKGNALVVEKPWQNYHVYAMEWTHEKIDFYCDSIKYFTFQNDFRGDDNTWPYDKPHFLIVNLAIGGNWGGQRGIDDSRFPQKYKIDYIRYYSLENKMK
jgi:beta-glucanase (GH16 family)